LSGSLHAHVFDSDSSTADVDGTDPPEFAHSGPDDASSLEPVVNHAATCWLLDTPSQSVRDVIEALRDERERWPGVHQAGPFDWSLAHVDVFVEHRRVQEPVDVDLAARGVQDLDGAVHPVERQALDDTGEAQAMVAVEVRDADAFEAPRRHAGEQQLALGTLARIKEDAVSVPTQQVAIVVAVTGGGLARSSKDD